MRITINLFLFSLILFTACDMLPGNSVTPESVYKSCKAVFKRKGDPMGLGEPMCASMRDACAEDLEGEQCKKAQRIIQNG